MKTVRTSLLYGTHSITKNYLLTRNMFGYVFYKVNKSIKRLVLRKYSKKKTSSKEDNKYNVIISELKKLEHDFSTDVAVLREQIELASLDFTEAQKKFDKLEKDYISAKLELFVAKERKEQLTNHLNSLIRQNEMEKAKTISGFVGKLELAPCPIEKQINKEGDSCEEKPKENEGEEKETAH